MSEQEFRALALSTIRQATPVEAARAINARLASEDPQKAVLIRGLQTPRHCWLRVRGLHGIAEGLQTPRHCWLRVRENHAVSTASSTRQASARHLDLD